jgi:hypothetical protein
MQGIAERAVFQYTRVGSLGARYISDDRQDKWTLPLLV